MRIKILVAGFVAMALLSGASGCPEEEPATSQTQAATPAPQVDAAPPPPSPLPQRSPNGTFAYMAVDVWVIVYDRGDNVKRGARIGVTTTSFDINGRAARVFNTQTGEVKPNPWERQQPSPYRVHEEFGPGIAGYSIVADHFGEVGDKIVVFIVKDGVEILGTRVETVFTGSLGTVSTFLAITG